MKNDVYEDFQRQTVKHQMEVKLHQGLYRHLRFAAPDTICHSFHIVTWPGYLAYAGDMGDFTFTRTDDMFEFFRRPDLKINPSYWSEKLVGSNRRIIAMEYSPLRAKQWIQQQVAEYELEGDAKAEALAIDTDTDEQTLRDELRTFDGHEDVFQGQWEANFHDYTFHFLWCCHALVWGIQQWDARPASEPVRVPA